MGWFACVYMYVCRFACMRTADNKCISLSRPECFMYSLPAVLPVSLMLCAVSQLKKLAY